MRLYDAKAFGAAVREYRKRQGATQIQLAAVANTGARFIGDLENGKPSVQLDKALRVAKILGIKIETPETDYYVAEKKPAYNAGCDSPHTTIPIIARPEGAHKAKTRKKAFK